LRLPDWYALLLLGLAAFRTWKLIGEDTILDIPRAWVVKRGGEYVEALLECPWCAGFWISLAWWGAYELWPHGSLIAAVPLAVSGLVGAFAYFTSDE
jgi:hypothetical protein